MKLLLNRKKTIIGAGGVAVALTMALAALGPTGAYFSDTEQGRIDGTIGSIQVDGVDSLNLHFTNLLPGESQTVSERYKNTGLNAQDVWVVFNDAEALHALNDLGNYGEFHVAANNNAVFDSANLNDDGDLQSPPGCSGIFDPAGCWPVPEKILLQSNLAPSAMGTVSFRFNYNGVLMTGQSEAGGGVWNSYPLPTPANPDAVATESGLPYQIVATQVGQEPGL
ncbi:MULTISPECIES: hypothetical protein [unclassified Cryobacterium]|uniref:hypothetical protein n=1 Tax=unclassified Cryobacterium TaxID=2649013 RepID=UPI000CE4795B|nr:MULTISPECIES: hypothetical protein [unclassified Cryobacterium]